MVVTAFTVTATSAAPREAVFALLADAASWSRWAGPLILRSWWEREGEPPPGGVGAIRRLGWGRASSREEIVAYDRPHHLAYVLLDTFPVRGYRGDVDLLPHGTGTLITWSARFDPALPGSAPLLRGLLRGLVGSFARRLARAAESDATSGPA